jgi:hypothetical protein
MQSWTYETGTDVPSPILSLRAMSCASGRRVLARSVLNTPSILRARPTRTDTIASAPAPTRSPAARQSTFRASRATSRAMHSGPASSSSRVGLAELTPPVAAEDSPVFAGSLAIARRRMAPEERCPVGLHHPDGAAEAAGHRSRVLRRGGSARLPPFPTALPLTRRHSAST